MPEVYKNPDLCISMHDTLLPVRGMGSMKRPAEDSFEPAKSLKTGDTWTSFQSSDPLYALMGELQKAKIVQDGEVSTENLKRFLHVMIVQGAAQKPKDWLQVWQAMEIPADSQSRIVGAIITFCLECAPQCNLGEVLAELLKGHAVKLKAVEEAVEMAIGANIDPQGVLQELLLGIFPKGPESDWGWSRIGWGWSEWWKTVQKIMASIDPTSAFVELGFLLEHFESKGGTPLQQAWSKDRVEKAGGRLKASTSS